MSLFYELQRPGGAAFLGGGGGGTSSTTSSATLPPELAKLITEADPLWQQSIAQMLGFQQQFPLQSLMQDLHQPITPLTGDELTMLGRQIGQANQPAISSPELAALKEINQVAGGPIGQSPATLAGLSAFEDLEKPRIEQDDALSGLSHAGAFADTINKGRTAVLQPLISQEIQDRMNVLGPLANIGDTVARRERGDTATALQAAGVPRAVADSMNASEWQDMMRRAQLVQSVDLGIFNSVAPNLIPPAGQTSKTRTTPTGIWSSLGNKIVLLPLLYSLLSHLYAGYLT